MVKDDYDEVCWQPFFGVCPAGVLVVAQLCFGGGWCPGGPLVVCPWCLDSVR